MISRRQLIGAGAAASVTSALSLPAFAAMPRTFTLGKDYVVVNPALPQPAGKIEVVSFFAYTCPHCLQFEQFFEDWTKTKPDDVVIRRCPVAWSEKTVAFTEAYFALEALGLLEKLHLPFFESVIYQTRTYNYENAYADIRAFMEENGVDGKKWDACVKSFSVKNKANQANMLWRSYQIDSTPMVGVGGRFVTGPSLVGSRTATPECITMLVNQVRGK